ncbi:putative reverse transcriptase domain-containing protein [Tanacetum coccineum]
MPIELGSFDVIIGMDWLSMYHAIIAYAEKIVRITWGSETLIVHGHHVFLAHVTTKETKDKSGEKRLEDLPIVQDFPKVFPEELFGLPLTRQVEFQIDFMLGATPTLKNTLCSTSILALPQGAKNFIVYCDVSHKGLGAALMQNEKVITYASRPLKIHEKNYTTYDLELVEVVFALKIWRHYLYGTKRTVFMDYKSLQHILDQKELNMRQRRWLEFLVITIVKFVITQGKQT